MVSGKVTTIYVPGLQYIIPQSKKDMIFLWGDLIFTLIMVDKMNDSEFIKRRSHFNSINPQTADYPPADDIAGLTDFYVEEVTARLMENLYNSPERIQEYLVESDYEFTAMYRFATTLGTVLADPALQNMNRFLGLAREFFELSVQKEARDYVEGL